MARPKTKKRVSKPLRRKRFLFIPYPLMVFVLLCTGVYLFAWTFNAHADDIIVNAIVKGKPVAGSPTVNNIENGHVYSAEPIEIAGACPPNAAYVKIFRNNIYAGSAICINGNYDPMISLFVGKNIIEVRGYNVTDDEGPVSNPLVIYYQPTQPQVNLQTGQPVPVTQKTEPLLVTTAFVYKGYYTGQEVQWPMEISGGTAPYALKVDWGDGQSSIISRKDSGKFFINHTYKQKSGEYNNHYTIKVEASDINGGYSYLEFFVIVNDRTAAGAGAGAGTTIYSKGPPTLGGLHDWVWAAWPLYGAMVLMVVAFKLGEREEVLLLKRHHRLKGS